MKGKQSAIWFKHRLRKLKKVKNEFYIVVQSDTECKFYPAMLVLFISMLYFTIPIKRS